MSIVGSFIIAVLIFGIHSCGITEGRTLNENAKFLGIIRNECEKNASPEAYDTVVEKLGDLSNCVELLLGTSQLQSEISNAESRSDLSKILREHCHKVPNFETCVKNVTEAIEPCVRLEERESVEIFYNVTSLALNFMCSDDRITTFIANGGLECLASKQSALEKCASKNFGNSIDDDSEESSFAIDDKSCSSMKKFQACSVEALEECENSIVAEIFDVLFDRVIEATPCEKFFDYNPSTSSPVVDGGSPIDGIQRIMSRKCIQNGGMKSYFTMMESFVDVESCNRMVSRNIYAAHERFTSDQRPITTVEFLRRYCNHIPEIEHCAETVTNSVKSCLNPVEHETVDIVYNAGKSILEFLCSDEAKGYADFVDAGGLECISSKQRDLEGCAEEFSDSYLPYDSNLRRFGEQLVINSQDCNNAKNFNKCLIKVVKECENQTIASFFESVIDSAMKPLTPCENYQKEMSEHRVSEGTSKQMKIYTSFEEKCETNGGPDAYIVATGSMDYVSAVITPLVSARYLQNTNLTDILPLIFKMLCQRVPILTALEKYLTSSVKPCFEVEEWESFEIIDNITSSSLEFICGNEGEHLTTLFQPDSEKCLKSTAEDVMACATDAFHLDDLYWDEYELFRRYDKPLILSPNDCIKFQIFKDCTMKVFANCERSTISLLANSFLEHVENATPCKQLLGVEMPLSTERISSSTEAAKDVLDFGVFPNLMFTLDALNPRNEFGRLYFQDMCLENGGITAYRAAKQISATVQRAIKALMANSIQFYVDMNIARLSGDLDRVIFKYCDEVPVIEKYMKHVVDTVNPCFEPKTRETVIGVQKAIESSLDFMCQNEGDRLEKFVDNHGLECITSNSEALNRCVSEAVDNISPSDGSIHGPNINIEECRAIETAEHCVIKVMQECGSETVVTVVAELINNLFDESPCYEILKEDMLNSKYFQTLGQVISRVVG